MTNDGKSFEHYKTSHNLQNESSWNSYYNNGDLWLSFSPRNRNSIELFEKTQKKLPQRHRGKKIY